MSCSSLVIIVSFDYHSRQQNFRRQRSATACLRDVKHSQRDRNSNCSTSDRLPIAFHLNDRAQIQNCMARAFSRALLRALPPCGHRFTQVIPNCPRKDKGLGRSRFGLVHAHPWTGGRALKPRLHQPYPSMASDMPVERVPRHMGRSRSILTGVFRIVLLSWAFVTAVVLWQLK